MRMQGRAYSQEKSWTDSLSQKPSVLRLSMELITFTTCLLLVLNNRHGVREPKAQGSVQGKCHKAGG